MLRLVWSALTASPVVLGASFLLVNTTLAAEISNLEPVPVQTASAFSEDSTKSVESAAVLLAQMPDIEVEKSQFSALTPSEPSPSEELANKTLDEPLPTPEATTAEPTVEDLEPIDGDSSSDKADDPMEQVTNVTQLRDVSPGDWAYEALR